MMKREDAKEFFTQDKNSFGLISSLFAFSLIWSLGASVDTPGRKIFDITFKRTVMAEIIMNNKKRKVGYPDKATIYDYQLILNPEELKYEWVKWTELI